MRYKISDAYLLVNGEQIAVGTVLGQEDKPDSPFRTETITNSEYEIGLKKFIYGKQRIGDMVYHRVGIIKDFIIPKNLDVKWIKELENMGYDISNFKFEE